MNVSATSRPYANDVALKMTVNLKWHIFCQGVLCGDVYMLLVRA